MQKVHEEPSQQKIQMVDDFSEDINVLTDRIEKEHQKEAFRKDWIHHLGKQFNVANNLNNLQLGNFLNDYDAN
jgi:hypothetical protein